MSAKPRGLGRGLDALLPKSPKSVDRLPLDALSVSPFQPRKTIDPDAIEELAASIADKGVLQPLLVRPMGDGYEIVAGERRFRAARQAGLHEVPVVVRELDDQATLEVAIVENLQREDLNPVEEATAFKQLLDFGLSQAEVAKAVGKSRSAVANTLRLLTLEQAALDALVDGTITAGHARAILGKDEQDRSWALDRIVAEGLSVRQAEALERKGKDVGRNPRSRSSSDGRYLELEEELTRQLGGRVAIRGGERGRVELHFHTRDELERWLELLGYDG